MWVIVHFVWWTFVAKKATFSNYVCLDLVVWVCAQGNCCRCLFILYCVHDHRSVIVSIHVTWVTLVSPCMWHASMCVKFWGAPTYLNTSMLALVVYISMKPCWCAISYQTRNSVGFSLRKRDTFVVVFSQEKLGENSILCTMMHLKGSAAGFSPRK